MNINLKLLYLAVPISLLKVLFEKYVFSDWEFLFFLIVIISIDTFFGLWKYWKLNLLSSKGFGRFFTKCIIYFAVLVLTHLLTSFTVKGVVNPVFGWIDHLMYSMIIVREAISIFENITAINPGILPAWILRKLKQFDDSGNLNDLKDAGVPEMKNPPPPPAPEENKA